MQVIKDYFIWFINLVMSLVALASLIFMIWGFHFFEDLYVQILMTTALSILPLLFLIEVRNPQSGSRMFSSSMFGVMLTSILFLAIAFGGRYNLSFLVLNSASLVLSLPLLFTHWYVVRRNRLLMVAVFPTIIMGSLYVASEIIQLDTALDTAADLLLLPLPFVLFIGLIWAGFARWFLERAKQSRHRPLLGPFMESITMFLLVVPLAALAMFSVSAVMEEDIWVAVAAILVGFLFSSAVSTPFRQFLRALGELDENRKGPIHITPSPSSLRSMRRLPRGDAGRYRGRRSASAQSLRRGSRPN